MSKIKLGEKKDLQSVGLRFEPWRCMTSGVMLTLWASASSVSCGFSQTLPHGQHGGDTQGRTCQHAKLGLILGSLSGDMAPGPLIVVRWLPFMSP